MFIFKTKKRFDIQNYQTCEFFQILASIIMHQSEKNYDTYRSQLTINF
jgi:hypothetical protein